MCANSKAMDYILIIVASLLIIMGLLGCILPIIPGPPLSFGGILILHFTQWGPINSGLLLWLGIAAALVTVLDYVFPIWATKRFGGSKRGVWGSTIGLIIGLLLFPPVGIIVGPFLGAFIGEITANQSQRNAIKSAFGSFVGFLLGTGLKFAVSGVITYYFIKDLFA